jgi:hypothetical protein
MVAIIGLIIFIISLLMYNGPSIPGFYTRGTSVGSVLQVRKRNPDFKAAKYLEEHPIPRVKPWGGFIINIDLNKVGNFFFCKKAKNSLPNVVAPSNEVDKFG